MVIEQQRFVNVQALLTSTAAGPENKPNFTAYVYCKNESKKFEEFLKKSTFLKNIIKVPELFFWLFSYKFLKIKTKK